MRAMVLAACVAACGRVGFSPLSDAAGGADADACGHSCLGGACVSGVCQPNVLASGQGSPFGIAIDADTVYWANNTLPGEFESCAKTGCGGVPTVLASARPLPASVFVSGGTLFMSEYGDPFDTPTVAGQVSRCVANDCAATLTPVGSANPGDPVAIVANATDVYFAADADGAIERVAATGGTPMPIATDMPYGPWYGLALDASNIYYTSRNDGVWSCPLPTGVCAQLAASTMTQGAWSLAIDTSRVYWTDATSGGVWSCPLAGCPGNGPTPIATGEPTPQGIAVDASFVYWLDAGNGTVVRCPLPACTASPEVLATGQGNVWEIAVDSTAIYWTSSDQGNVVMLAKP